MYSITLLYLKYKRILHHGTDLTSYVALKRNYNAKRLTRTLLYIALNIEVILMRLSRNKVYNVTCLLNVFIIREHNVFNFKFRSKFTHQFYLHLILASSTFPIKYVNISIIMKKKRIKI